MTWVDWVVQGCYLLLLLSVCINIWSCSRIRKIYKDLDADAKRTIARYRGD